MAVEVVIGFIAQSLALITDTGHMLTDAAEIISAQINGITLLLLSAWFVYEGIHRLIDPPAVEGLYVVVTGAAGIAMNTAATWLLSKANRSSLNIEGAFQHLLNDLYAFIGTTIAGLIVWLTGWARADAIAALLVAALTLKAGWGLVRGSGRVFMEAAPTGVRPDEVGARTAALDHVVEVHDLHIWEVTSSFPGLSAHILVVPGADCHAVRLDAEQMLHDAYGIGHTTRQVDHAISEPVAPVDAHCADPHGPVHAGSARTSGA
ncbi:cation diffusion facilitator family transporter [Streptomyces phaeochromogenes]|uniref:cation diffusion facilitator family transporter n=1 Tax=Streptomyces phaeochromogenes TaxID=1923 RepID=UPI002DD8C745|nr:cation diffusion facilitator family transporter [Streptomyces phaeochromogenes]WRZ36594.1 cation diffusion facilitator family transporter [Streptomyces phaeochromogenes]